MSDKITYVEPSDYFPEDVRKKHGLGEYADSGKGSSSAVEKMDTSEKRFERDIESFLISEKGGYEQFNGQDADGNWVHNRQHDVARCIYLDVLCDFIAKTQGSDRATASSRDKHRKCAHSIRKIIH